MSLRIILTALLLSFAMHGFAAAQYGGNTGGLSTGGTTGGYSTGGTSSGTSGNIFGSSGSSGNSTSPSSGSSTGSFGNRSASGAGSNTGNDLKGVNDQMLGANSAAAQGYQFVGNDSNQLSQRMFGNVNAQANALQGLMRNRNNTQNINANSNQQGNARTKRTVPTVHTIDFALKRPVELIQNQRLSDVLNRITDISPNKTINVEMQGRTAVLKGSVASNDAKELAEGVMLLDPAVLSVKNELIVSEEVPIPAKK